MGQQITQKEKTSLVLVPVCGNICCAHSWSAVAVCVRVSEGLSCGPEIVSRLALALIRNSGGLRCSIQGARLQVVACAFPLRELASRFMHVFAIPAACVLL